MNNRRIDHPPDRCLNPTEADERAHLEHVIERIAAELQAFSGRLNERLAESHDMAVAIHENKRDMDHAEKAVMRQTVSTLTRINEHGMSQHEKLMRLVESPYFGRIDLEDAERPHDRPVYIGLHSFTDPQPDPQPDPRTEAQLVHDWRAPISSMFYDFELGAAHYDAPGGRVEAGVVRKRQYTIERRELKMMLDTSVSIQDDILRDELSRTSDAAMRNIVATIQREQNAIIRNERAHSLVIQGAAGSGKTSIALHRIAFLLYRFREELSSKEVLIVSPNRVFASYIAQVLPELGEEMIQETTMEMIAGQMLGAGFKAQPFSEQVAVLLEGKDRQYVERVRFKATTEFVERLDAFMTHMRGTNFVPAAVEMPPYTFDAGWIADRFRPHVNLPIGEQIIRVIAGIVEHMRLNYEKEIVGKMRASVRAQLTAMFGITTLGGIYKEFFAWLGEPKMFRKASGGRYEWSDIYPLIHLSRLVDRAAPSWRIKHVVIDEMQDYSPIQYRVIDALYPCRKTILGDRNQSVSPASSSTAESIGAVLRAAEIVTLRRSYRSTIEILRVAQTVRHNPDLDPIERHGERPTLVRCADRDAEVAAVAGMLDDFRASEHRTLGVVCRDEDQAQRLHAELAAISEDRDDVQLLDTRSVAFSGGIMVTSAFLAKGLEFDRVVVPHCDDGNFTEAIDRHMLYIACTRAMHRLAITHSGEPSPLLSDAIEGGLVDISGVG